MTLGEAHAALEKAKAYHLRCQERAASIVAHTLAQVAAFGAPMDSEDAARRYEEARAAADLAREVEASARFAYSAAREEAQQ